jgi:hypothetical protein
LSTEDLKKGSGSDLQMNPNKHKGENFFHPEKRATKLGDGKQN